MLRNRLPDQIAEYPDPKRGINLRKSPEDLAPDEAFLLTNCHWDGGLRKRTGSILFSTPSLGNLEATGGTLFSYGNNQKVRLVAGGTNLWSIADSGAMLSTLTSTLTAGLALHFRTWPITDRVYLANGTDAMRYYDGSEISTISGTNVPASPTMVVPFSDRLFAIQGAVVVSSNARSDSVWATTGSAWSAYRPFASGAWPTALGLHSATGELGDPNAYLLIFQRNAVYGLRGTDFGDNVAGGSPSTGWDAELILFDPRIGTSSPYSVVTVPGLGTFWLTTERNIAWLPFGSTNPRLIGDALITTNRTDVIGLNLIDSVNLDEVQMVYHDRKLKLMIPESGNAYCTIAYWMDLRPLHENLGAILRGDADEGEAVAWSGPHTIQPVKRAWVEQETGDLERLMALGGRATTFGLYVYELNPYEVYTEAIATTSSNEYTFDWKSFYNNAGQPTYRKYLPKVILDAGGYLRYATVTVTDLHGTLTSGFAPMQLNGTAFTDYTYGYYSGGGVPVTTNLEAWYRYGLGITEAGSGVSQWNDASGNARHLLQATDANRPAKQSDGSILFDGVNDFMQTADFTLNQPTTYYLLFKQVTWTNNDTILDGNAASTNKTYQAGGVPPAIFLQATAADPSTSNLAVDTYGVLVAVYNGASSLIQIDHNASVTGNPGVTNAGGITLGADGDGANNHGNIQVRELIVYSGAHNASTRTTIINYLQGIIGEYRYGNGVRYGQNSVNILGEVAFDERSSIVPLGDALQIRVQAGIKKFILRRCNGRMSVERFEPVD